MAETLEVVGCLLMSFASTNLDSSCLLLCDEWDWKSAVLLHFFTILFTFNMKMGRLLVTCTRIRTSVGLPPLSSFVFIFEFVRSPPSCPVPPYLAWLFGMT